MKNSIWSGRFQNISSELLCEFNASISFDKKLYKYDIQGSKAHANMLYKCNIINENEFKAISDGLDKIEYEIEKNIFVFNIKDEDIHMAIENRLNQLIGTEIGGKLHTARSRNDQVATDLKLYIKDQNLFLQKLLKQLISTILIHIKNNKNNIMPSFTHLQHAQPISISFWLLAYAFMFVRDIKRLDNTYKLSDTSPLGACACAGTSYKTDRNLSAKLLNFSNIVPNAMDAVSDRDFVLDLLYDISIIFMHMSRLCEELILFSSSEFDFIKISDSYSTGSSIMPQKKNPDVAELIRGKTGRTYGNLISLLTTMKSLPLAYNKDMQEDKEPIFDSITQACQSILILSEMLKELSFNVDIMKKSCEKGHLLATDLADYLVREKNIPFRKAHFIVGKIVAKAESMNIDLSEIKNLHSLESLFDEKAQELLDFTNSINSKQSLGSSSLESIETQIKILETFLEN